MPVEAQRPRESRLVAPLDRSTADARSARWDWRRLQLACDIETRRVLGRSAAAEDATQEALLRAWRQRSACRTLGSPVAWVRAIARREALRIAGRRPEVLAETADSPAGYEPDVARSMMHVDLHRALGRLGDAERTALLLRYWGDLTQAEVALHVGVPAGTARVRLHRARARLRADLEEYSTP